MGRAIHMENDIEKLKAKVSNLEKAITTCIYKIEQFDDTLQGIVEKATTVTNIDLLEEEETKDDKKKTNTKGTGKSNKCSNSKSRATAAKAE